MGCSTCGGARKAAPAEVFVVTYPNGATKEVPSEHAAKVEAVREPGATYARK